MGVPQTMVVQRERTALVKESLQNSKTVTDNMVGILSSFDSCLSALETAMRSTQVGERTHAIRKAHENIDKSLKAAEIILAQFDLTRKVICDHMGWGVKTGLAYIWHIKKSSSNVPLLL